MSYQCPNCKTVLDSQHSLSLKQHYNQQIDQLTRDGYMYTYHTIVPPFHRYVAKRGESTQSLLGIMCQRNNDAMIRPVYILMTALVEKVDIWLDECIVSPLSDRSTYHGDGMGCGYGDSNVTAYELLHGVRDILIAKQKEPSKTMLRNYGELISVAKTKEPSRSMTLSFQATTSFFDTMLEDVTAKKKKDKQSLVGKVVTAVCNYDLFQDKWFILLLRVHPSEDIPVAVDLMNKYMYGKQD